MGRAVGIGISTDHTRPGSRAPPCHDCYGIAQKTIGRSPSNTLEQLLYFLCPGHRPCRDPFFLARRSGFAALLSFTRALSAPWRIGLAAGCAAAAEKLSAPGARLGSVKINKLLNGGARNGDWESRVTR